MIELLLQAERALSMGLPDQAERLYVQAIAADPRNSIAVVGLARVALERADEGEAYRLAREALTIDPENVAAARLARRLEETRAARQVPELAPPPPPPPPMLQPPPPPAQAPSPPPVMPSEGALLPAPVSATSQSRAPVSAMSTAPAAPPLADRSRLDRLLRRYRP